MNPEGDDEAPPIDGFVLTQTIGQGGMGTVFRAEPTEAGKGTLPTEVAIKVLRTAFRDDAEHTARFRREAALLAKLDAEGIVPILATGELADGRPYLVMPLLRGRSLRAMIRAEGGLDPAAAWRLLRPIARALATAHDAGVVHRDVKPDNVFLEETKAGQRVRLLDFGLAKRFETAAPSTSAADVFASREGVPLGSPPYMAPELWWGEASGPAGDAYAFGVTLHEAIAGEPPFRGGIAELLEAHLHRAPPPASRALSAEQSALIATLLAKRPADRGVDLWDVVSRGDAAFGAPSADRIPRPSTAARYAGELGALALAAAIPIAIVLLVGYADPIRHRFDLWPALGGAPVCASLALFLIVLLALPSRLRKGLAPLLLWVLAPAASGTLGTYTGWFFVARAALRSTPTHAFSVLHDGRFEANLDRFVGFGLSAALAFAAGVLLARRRAGTSAAVFLMAIVVVFLCGALAVTRLDAEASALWSADVSRAERAVALSHLDVARSIVFPLATAATVALLLTFGITSARAWQRGVRPDRASLAGFGVLAVVVGIDLWVGASFVRAARDATSRLAPEFALFAHLEPPPSGTAARVRPFTAPTLAPALQASRDVVAVDGIGVAPLTAFADKDANAMLMTSLARTLATAPMQGRIGGADLAVFADGSLSPAFVLRLLRDAYAAGARHIEVIFTRGVDALPAMASEEDDYALPSDFSALPMTLERGDVPDDALRAADWKEAARGLATRALEGSVRLSVGAE